MTPESETEGKDSKSRGAQRRSRGISAKIFSGLASILDYRAMLHVLRMMHYYNYSHVRPSRLIEFGAATRIAPNVSFSNGERIKIGDRTQIGARCSIWAGDETGRILIGSDATFGPDCMLTSSNYGSAPDKLVTDQKTAEKDIIIGDGVWLGAKTVVTAGVVIGDGCIVGAGSVVTRDLPPGAIAAGVPARVVKFRDGRPAPTAG